MREKLLDLMKSEGLKSSQLAEMLEINPAGISHILAGRNKPGFDLLQKILRRFPKINPDWLLLDSKTMYRDQLPTISKTEASTSNNVSPETGLFDTQPRIDNSQSAATSIVENFGAQARANAPGQNNASITAITARPGVAVERIVIFYQDQTFESYIPKA